MLKILKIVNEKFLEWKSSRYLIATPRVFGSAGRSWFEIYVLYIHVDG